MFFRSVDCRRGRPVTLRRHEPASEASIDLEGPDPDASA